MDERGKAFYAQHDAEAKDLERWVLKRDKDSLRTAWQAHWNFAVGHTRGDRSCLHAVRVLWLAPVLAAALSSLYSCPLATDTTSQLKIVGDQHRTAT